MSLFSKSYSVLALSVILLSGCGQAGPLFLENSDTELARKHRERQIYAEQAAEAEAAMEARKKPQAQTNAPE